MEILFKSCTKAKQLAFSPNKKSTFCKVDFLRGQDLNLRSQGYGPCEIPGFSTPQYYYSIFEKKKQNLTRKLL